MQVKKDSIPSFFRCSTPNRVLDLKKVKIDCSVVSKDNRAPFDVTCSIPLWMMLESNRMSKDPLFPSCDIMKLGRMQIQDPDDGVSNPTHLAVKPDSNRFRNILDIVLKRWRAAI